ncbi:MAG: signal peptide peptidase SppA [bacterium]
MFKKLKDGINKIKYTVFKDKRIALIKLEGIILDSGYLSSSSKIIESLKNVKTLGIKTIVLRINSPGGTVGASQEIYTEIKKLQKDGTKVVVSLGDVAASGGLYVAVAGDKIVSNPGTVTGSIGVIIKSSVIKDLYKKIGIEHQIVKSGPYKDILSQTRFFTEEEKTILQELIDVTYNQFVKTISENRNIDIEEVKKFADGRIFTGAQAKEYGIVDSIGSQSDAIDLAAELAEIKGEPVVVEITSKKSLLQKISGANVSAILEKAGINSVHSRIPLWIMPEN